VMKPFSPLYFIRENRARCAVLIFMIFLSFAAYLAGLYVMNVVTSFEEFGEELYDSAALVYVRTRDEEGFQGYRDAVEAMRQEEDIRFVDLGYYNYLNMECIMSFTVGYQSLTFINKEDFKLFCEMKDISCDVDSLGSRSVVMSERMANSLGLKVGDVLTPEEFSGVSEAFTLEAITDQTTYAYYFLAEDAEPMNAMILNTGMEEKHVIGRHDFANMTVHANALAIALGKLLRGAFLSNFLRGYRNGECQINGVAIIFFTLLFNERISVIHTDSDSCQLNRKHGFLLSSNKILYYFNIDQPKMQ